MGANFSTLQVHCCIGRDRNREDNEDPVMSIDLTELEKSELRGQNGELHVPHRSHDEPDAQISAFANSSADPLQHSIAAKRCDSELQDKIKAIVDARMNIRKQSLVPSSSDATSTRAAHSPQVLTSTRDELQDQINVIVRAHASSLKQQRLALQEVTPLASPSPAKSLTDSDIRHFAKLAVSGAKDRKTPAKSPVTPYGGWSGGDFVPRGVDFVPRHLSFADCDDTPATQKVLDAQSTATLKVQTGTSLNEIPTPCRDRAVKMPRPAESEHACKEGNESKAIADDEKSRLEIEEAMEMAEMDAHCVRAFLECVKTCAWREKVRTPIKGTNLYTKHMRPCRPSDTSVDVKDSSFKTLRNFLQFLESEGLLHLQPGVSDPVVAQIHFNACRKYKYTPRVPEPAKSD